MLVFGSLNGYRDFANSNDISDNTSAIIVQNKSATPKRLVLVFYIPWELIIFKTIEE